MMADTHQEIRSLWKDNRQLAERLSVQERHLDDHVCACIHNWKRNEKAMDAMRGRVNWVIGIMIGGLGAVIGMLFKLLTMFMDIGGNG